MRGGAACVPTSAEGGGGGTGAAAARHGSLTARLRLTLAERAR